MSLQKVLILVKLSTMLLAGLFDIGVAVEKAVARRTLAGPLQNAPSGLVPRSVNLREVADSDYQTYFAASKKPLLLVFSAPWCNPCIKLESQLATLEEQLKERVEMFKVTPSPVPASSLSDFLYRRFFPKSYPERIVLPQAVLIRGAVLLGRYDPEADEDFDSDFIGVMTLLKRKHVL